MSDASQILQNPDAIITAIVYTIGIFVIYLVRDNDTKISQFENAKTDIHRAIKSNLDEKIKSSLCEIISKLYFLLPSRSNDNSEDECPDEDGIFDEILLIISRHRQSRNIGGELKNIENLFRQQILIERNWDDYHKYGKYVKISGYLFVISLIPLPLYLSFNIYLCLISIFIMVIFIYLWVCLERIQAEFLKFEREFYN